MKTIVFCFLVSFFMAACAGNPPAWWNPSNSYNGPSQVRGSAPKTVKVAPNNGEQEITPAEENLTPLPDESYEEMILTPLQDEETEDPANKTPQDTQNTMDITPSASMGSMLPPPSVLE